MITSEILKVVEERKVFTPLQLKVGLTDAFHRFDIHPKIIIQFTEKLQGHDFAISGEYDTDGAADFYITIYLSPEADSCGIKIDDADKSLFVMEIMETVVHELQHWYQDQARDGDPSSVWKWASNDNEYYYGDYDEIDAYASSISFRLSHVLGTKGALNVIRSTSQLAAVSCDFNEYIEIFDKDHPIVKRLLKKIYRNILT